MGAGEDKNEPGVKKIGFQKMQLNTHEQNFVIKAMNKKAPTGRNLKHGHN